MDLIALESICRKEQLAGVGPCWFHPNIPNRATGYCQLSLDGRRVYVHVLAAELFNGRPTPKGMETDHLCNPKDGTKTNRACCNPAHLEVVTARVNHQRGEPASRTHCPKGHEYTQENTKVLRKQCGKYFKIMRECVICRNAWMREINRRRRGNPAYREENRKAQIRYRARQKLAKASH